MTNATLEAPQPKLADFPHLVSHAPVPNDPYDRPSGNPSSEPFEALGAEVLDLSWENAGLRRSLFPSPFPDFYNPSLQRFRESFDFLEVIRDEKDEFQRLLLLRDWVHRKLPRNNSEQPSFSPSLPK